MKKIYTFVKILLLIIISGCNTTVINKQELKNKNMKTEEIIKMIDEEIDKVQEYDEWSNNYRDWETDRKSTRLNSSHSAKSRMPSSA